MQNTTLTPTYHVSVKFDWKYPSKPIQTIIKEGYISLDSTDENVIAKNFIDTFISAYEVGICEVNNILLQSVKRIYTFDEWVEKYNPIKNEFEDSSFEGYTFDYTEDDQWEFVKNQNPENIWTMVDYDDTYIVISGCHWVNRESYLVTRKPVEKEDLSTEFLVIE